MKYIFTFLIIQCLNFCYGYIPNCKFTLDADVKSRYIVSVIPKNKFCCTALLPECIECQEEAINGIPMEDYCDLYSCSSNNQPLDEDGNILNINEHFDFDIGCKKSLHNVGPEVSENCGRGSHYKFTNCIQPCENVMEEEGVLSYIKTNNVCQIDECKEGYYLNDDTCIPCSETLKDGHYCPKGTNSVEGKICPQGYYRKQYTPTEKCLRSSCFIFKVEKASCDNKNGNNCKIISCKEGYYLNQYTQRCETCVDKLRDGYYCPAGSTQMISNPTHIGELCPPGSYRNSNLNIDPSECISCPDIYPFSPSGSMNISSCSLIQTSSNVLEDMTTEEICIKYSENIDNCKKYIMIPPLYNYQYSPYHNTVFVKHRQKSKHLFNKDWDNIGLPDMTTKKFELIRKYIRNNLIKTRDEGELHSFKFINNDGLFNSKFLSKSLHSNGKGNMREIRHKIFHTIYDVACEMTGVNQCDNKIISSIEIPKHEFEISSRFNIDKIEKIIAVKGGTIENPTRVDLEDLMNDKNEIVNMLYSPLNEFEVVTIFYKNILKYVLEGGEHGNIKMLYPKKETFDTLKVGTTWDEKLYMPYHYSKKNTFSVEVGSLQIGILNECLRPQHLNNTLVEYEKDLSVTSFNVSIICKEGYYGNPTATCDKKGEYNIIDTCKKCNPTYGNYCPKGSTSERGSRCPKNSIWSLKNKMKSCNKCEYDKWSEENMCITCKDNKAVDPFSFETNENQCTFCKEGYKGNGDKIPECEKCPEGEYSTSNSITKTMCNLCDIDYHWNGTSCIQCPEGYTNINPTYSHGPPQTCMYCSPGYHSNGTHCLTCNKMETNTVATPLNIRREHCNECSSEYKYNGKECVPCRKGYTNTIPTKKIKRYVCYKCDEDYHNIEGSCEPCPYGYYNAKGFSLVDVNTRDKCYMCEENWRITQSGHCEKCLKGTYVSYRGHTNLKGSTAHGGGTICKEKTCNKDEHVHDFDCVACPKGRWKNSGDMTLGGDTSCNKIICPLNHSVHGHECVPCDKYMYNDRRDDATGPDTYCHYIKCSKNQHVKGHVCHECPAGQYNKGGDYIFNGETECDGIYISPVKIVKSIHMTNPSNDISDEGMIGLLIIITLLVAGIVWLICRSAKKPSKKIRKTSSPYAPINEDDKNTIVNPVYKNNNNGLMRYRRFNMAKKGKMHYQVVKYDF